MVPIKMSASIVLGLFFIIFRKYEPRSYEIGLIKKREYAKEKHTIAACSSCVIELLFLIDVKTRTAQSFENQI